MTILQLYLQVFDQWFPDEAFSYFSIENHTVQMSQPFSENKLTNRFHVAVRLFSNRSQMTSKCDKNKKWHTRQ